MTKTLRYGQDARLALLRGIDQSATAVGYTLGPHARGVLFRNPHTEQSHFVHDGAQTTKEIDFRDPATNMGARLIDEVAKQTRERAGDGAATAVVLARALMRGALSQLAAGASPVGLRRGLERAADRVIAQLRAEARPVEGADALRAVALSAVADREIADGVAAAFAEVGTEGVVFVEDAHRNEVAVERVRGWHYDRGLCSPRFLLPHHGVKAVVEEPWLLLTDRKLSEIGDVLPLIEALTPAARRDFAIICDGIEGDALGLLTRNNGGLFTCAVVHPPDWQQRRRDYLDDIALFTGGRVISEALGRRLADVQLSDLGRAARFEATNERTLIVDGRGDPAAIEQRCRLIRSDVELAHYDFDKQKFRERIAKLQGRVAILRVGGRNERETKARTHQAERAVAVVQAALAEGVVLGGGLALFNAGTFGGPPGVGGWELGAGETLSISAPNGHASLTPNPQPPTPTDEALGAALLAKALEAPIRWLARSNGREAATTIARLRAHQADAGNRAIGYDVRRNDFADLAERGIIDPVGVVCAALDAAVSAAAMLITTEAVVAESEPLPMPKKITRAPRPAPPPPIAKGMS